MAGIWILKMPKRCAPNKYNAYETVCVYKIVNFHTINTKLIIYLQLPMCN